VLFLDEPTIGLDPQTPASIWEYVADLKRREDITVGLHVPIGLELAMVAFAGLVMLGIAIVRFERIE
jgi:ABC-type transporter Mla maintaining outer membrane lipid asymmetry ATPase subunit MlaF